MSYAPISEFITGNIGGIVSRSVAGKQGRLNGNSALWDGAPRLSPRFNRIYSPGGELPDTVANALFDAGLIREADCDVMWQAIKAECTDQRKLNESGSVLISKGDMSAFASMLGSLGRGHKKRMSPKAIEQRRRAGIASGFARKLGKEPF